MTPSKTRRCRYKIKSPGYRLSRYDKFNKLASFYSQAAKESNIHPFRYNDLIYKANMFTKRASWYLHASFFKDICNENCSK